ncbi:MULTISPECIES: AfsR/SARP family transcriptional regulator [Streptomyces]|uniref:AfsR/SARP family transcriptional regulator n=1 Tax=Streptomyces TaxID=1883 RepID=UPI00163B66AD|nr:MULTISPECIES: AfsR/SARP family transcriptional regulator [Streptomyces]MBC2875365.1 winged helix-turn-helix domain-containing protein [Streptomyces sp. TYQ1024]UBI35612.1 winged helix-turn-helix domain-containing protein [Streptomyces mobaraensis]UKW28207.1 NB-ARC domain-containing protein [Streptomyces sp. TYQ1024]
MTQEADVAPLDIEFRILGPIRIAVAGQPLTIASTNQRVVLAMLLLDAGQAVPISRLIDAVWDDDPPTTARNGLQLCVSQLRKRFVKAGAGHVVVTHPVGYLIREPKESLDMRRFQEHVKTASAISRTRPSEAVGHYRAGLSLWHGDAVSDLSSCAVQPAAMRLNEGRLTAQEMCLDLELQLGRHAQVVGELTELVARYQFRERFRKQLMLALCRSGRQAEALDVYRRWRELNREELGLDPSSELRELHQAIINGDHSLALPRQPVKGTAASTRPPAEVHPSARPGSSEAGAIPVPRQLPLAVTGFVGRGALVAQLKRRLVPPADKAEELVKLVVLTGRGGMGKTALAVHVGHSVADEFPDGQLYAEVGDQGGSWRDQGQILGGWLRAAGIPASAIPEGLGDRAAMYRSWLAGKRVLVVLDEVTEQYDVTPLLPGTPGCAVIVTSRSRMVHLTGADRLSVGPLGEPSASDLLSWLIGRGRADSEPDGVRDLVEFCGGIPLALRIAGSKLAERPHWKVEQLRTRLADERRRLDELDLGGTNVRATLAFAYRGLTSQLRHLLRRLSLLETTDFPAWAAATAMDVDLKTAEDMLAELVSAQLLDVRVANDGTPRYNMENLVLIFLREASARDEPQMDRREVLRC